MPCYICLFYLSAIHSSLIIQLQKALAPNTTRPVAPIGHQICIVRRIRLILVIGLLSVMAVAAVFKLAFSNAHDDGQSLARAMSGIALVALPLVGLNDALWLFVADAAGNGLILATADRLRSSAAELADKMRYVKLSDHFQKRGLHVLHSCFRCL